MTLACPSKSFNITRPVTAIIVTLMSVAATLGITATMAHAQATAAAPDLLLGRGGDLLAAKQRYDAGDPAIRKAVARLIRNAEAALTQPVTAVTQKDPSRVATSGDMHDYTSLSPYWWPDPAKADGLPYIRKDGQVNPDRSLYDEPAMSTLGESVRDLSLAYYFTGDERFAQNAARRLRVWFVDPATRMNPNLNYAQFKPGHEQINHNGVIESGRLLPLPDAMTQLRGSLHWTDADDRAVRAWFTQYLDWLENSVPGQAEQAAPNNHGTWCHVQIVMYSLYVGRDDLAKAYLDRIPARIAAQIEPDGRQPLELERTKALDYSEFNLRAMFILASLGQRVGVDLWGYRTDDGRSLRVALDYLVPYMTDPDTWPYKQITDPKFSNYSQTLRRAAYGFKAVEYEKAIATLPEPLSDDSWLHLIIAPYPGD